MAIKIIVEKHGDGFRAHKSTSRATWAAGDTIQSAIGSLIMTHPTAFRLDVNIHNENPAKPAGVK